MIRPGNVIAGGARGMGPCPPPQHQQPGGAYAHGIFCVPIYIPCIYMVYIMDIPGICRCHSIYHVYNMYIHGIYTAYSLNM